MSLWIKICGNTTLADARVALDAGADAVGFVFAPSPRRVTPAQAAAIVAQLPASIEKIGVFVEAGFEEIAATVEIAGLTGVQLHWDAPPELPARLRARLGSGLRILGVFHFDPASAEAESALTFNAETDAILVDSRTASVVGGTGRAYDWNAARQTIFDPWQTIFGATGLGPAGKIKLIAAGGLTPENAAEAVATLRPWGVDVVSGLEAAPGRKDPAKVRAFIANARAAAKLLSC
jgi:phosphoribosylanthranilate isomerase